jgi:nanoRNase/pAp phosphatase (c-di-AMP/oligoRNAs hydrolase)
MIRKMEGAELTFDRLEYVSRAQQTGSTTEQVFCAFLGRTAREDFIPYVADFFLQVEDVKWTMISGIVGDTLVVSVRNLGYTRNAGEMVRKLFADVGSAGGHRAMAKAVMPLHAFREKFGLFSDDAINLTIRNLAVSYLREHAATEKKKDSAKA